MLKNQNQDCDQTKHEPNLEAEQFEKPLLVIFEFQFYKERVPEVKYNITQQTFKMSLFSDK